MLYEPLPNPLKYLIYFDREGRDNEDNGVDIWSTGFLKLTRL